MKRLLCGLPLAIALFSATASATDVGVSVSVGQPGFYGRIDIDNLPAPQLVYPSPILIQPAPIGIAPHPIYLHVPRGHAKNWRKHCGKYNACGQPVYFVQETWYNNVYVVHHRSGAYRGKPSSVALPAPTYRYPQPQHEPLYEVPVRSVRAVVGPPEQRCWVERQQVVEPRSQGANIPGAIVGAVIGGVLGHQVGGGRGRDVATAGGAVAGAAIGASVGQGGEELYSRDVQRCVDVQHHHVRPEYWEVIYDFRGVVHRVQMSAPPGRTITIDANGEPRGW
jgi:uncharacterized protein YcfJ